LFESLVSDVVALDELKRLAGSERLNMTGLALNLPGYCSIRTDTEPSALKPAILMFVAA
jgi:hypothetical protein